MCEVDGDGLMGCPQVPEFWLIEYGWDTRPDDVKRILHTLQEMGFRIHIKSYPTIKISHSKKKYISVWMLKHSEMILKNKLRIKYYIHNTRRSKKELSNAV
jgi:hypothetical protein